MEVDCKSKGGIHTPALILAMMMLIMMLLNAYCCGAAVLAESNTRFRCSSGRLDECLIEEDLELELGFLMNPYVSRILAKTGTGNAGNAGQPVFAGPCGKPGDPAYAGCVEKAKPKPSQCVRKNDYSRPCGTPP